MVLVHVRCAGLNPWAPGSQPAGDVAEATRTTGRGGPVCCLDATAIGTCRFTPGLEQRSLNWQAIWIGSFPVQLKRAELRVRLVSAMAPQDAAADQAALARLKLIVGDRPGVSSRMPGLCLLYARHATADGLAHGPSPPTYWWSNSSGCNAP